MKKTLASLVLVLVFVTISTAQTDNLPQPVKYGVKGGLTISNMDYKGATTTKNPHRNGFLFGIFAEIPLSEKMAFMPELQFSPEGANVEDYNSNYVNLPLVLKHKLFNRVAIGLGPQAGLKVHKANDGYKNFVYSGVGMLEVQLADAWFTEVRYNHGFTNVFDNDQPKEATTGVIQLAVSYKIF